MRVKIIKTAKGNREQLVENNLNVSKIEHIDDGLSESRLVFTLDENGEKFKIDLKDVYYMNHIVIVKRESV